MKYNEEYYFPVYLTWIEGREIWDPRSSIGDADGTSFIENEIVGQPIPTKDILKFYELEGISSILYYDSTMFRYPSIPPDLGSYSLLSSSFNYTDTSGVSHYPLFLDRNLLVTKNINNINSNVTFDGEIIDLSGKKYFTFLDDYCNIIENLNLDFNSDILVNGCYFKLRNIKNDLDFNKVNDPSNNQKYSYFLFQEKKPKLTDIKAIDENSTVSDLIITIPSKPWSENEQ